MPGGAGEVNTTLPLILNIVALVLCGGNCIGLVPAIIGIVMAVQAGSAATSGDLVTAKAKAKTSMTLAIVTAVLGLVCGIAYMTFIFVAAASNSR